MNKTDRIPDETRAKIADMARARVPDAEIAAILDIHPSTAKRIRLSFGINKGVRSDSVIATPEQITDLNHISDRAMERKYGITHQTWSRIRQRHGIPRFRAPTTGVNKAPKVEKVRGGKGASSSTPWGVTIAKPRECTVATEAADFLRRDRWIVVNRKKVYDKPGWDVGRMRMTEEELIAMAQRRGFKREYWMA